MKRIALFVCDLEGTLKRDMFYEMTHLFERLIRKYELDELHFSISTLYDDKRDLFGNFGIVDELRTYFEGTNIYLDRQYILSGHYNSVGEDFQTSIARNDKVQKMIEQLQRLSQEYEIVIAAIADDSFKKKTQLELEHKYGIYAFVPNNKENLIKLLDTFCQTDVTLTPTIPETKNVLEESGHVLKKIFNNDRH